MKKQPKHYIFYMGIAVFAAGLLLEALFTDADRVMQSLSLALAGFGSGIVMVGAVNLYRLRLLKNNPEKAKQIEINEKDERNIWLREKAGYTTWYITLFTLAILSMTLLVLDYKTACWLSLGALFIHIASLFIFINIYNKKI